MRNLRNVRHSAIEFRDFTSLSATTWDSTGLICSFGPTADEATITLKRLHNDSFSPDEGVLIASWDAPSPNPDLAVDRVLSLHCFQDIGSICLVLEGGDIIVIREDAQPGEELIEIVGTVDAGITAATWSPDEELLVIATKENTLLFMTREFEGTASVSLSPDDLRVSSHVSVGWGKRETQFQGRGAKALRDPTVPEHVDEGRLSGFDDSRTTITWRGDGQYVAVNSILEGETRRRVIRVYSREGALDSVSEPVDGLEGALSWKPSGQLIAGVQRTSDKIDIVFFERNGLRHGQFSLRLSQEEMSTIGSNITLSWNLDSSVLAVSLNGRVQLWTMGNYHYYLKQEIAHQPGTAVSSASVWHSEKPLRLACFQNNTVRLLDYSFEVSRGSVLPPHDIGVTAVIDGKHLKVTPLGTANVPPPMAFDEIDLPDNAIDVAFDRSGARFAVLHSEFVSIWTCDYDARPAKRAKLEKTMSFPDSEEKNCIAYQVAVGSADEIVVAACSANEQGTTVLKLASNKSEVVKDSHDISVLFGCANQDVLLAEDSKGELLDFSSVSEYTRSIAKLPSMCSTVEVWQEDISQITFGLTSGGILHILSDAQSLKIPGCTSFLVTATHLIYTTSQHLLKFIHLHTGELDVPPDEPEKDERCRNIERGAKLVTVMPSAFSLVLQMPRGNLETINPRALVLAAIRQAISNQNYKKAFSICRTHRVDMNILHDYAPEQFMRDVDLFVKQLRKVDHIDLFLSSLSEENVSLTTYKETLKVLPQHTNGLDIANGDAPKAALPTSSKVNRICDAFLQRLHGLESTHLQSVVTAHVCKNPPDLESGLSLVAELRKQGKQEQLEQAVEHICFLADVNQLYDTALGIYDLDVALLVAQQSQKDPREYLPYLQNLHDMEKLRQRHAIDNDLKRHAKALGHLHAMGEFEEVKSYATKHELYSTAIELYRYDSARLAELMRLHADFLSSRNRYKEAGIAYEFITDYASAYEAYKACGLWRECLACAGIMGMSDEKMTALAKDVADSLEEAKDYTGAATVYLDHLQDIESAVRLLCRAYQFADAMRHIALRKSPELLRTLVDPGLIEASATMTEMLAEMKTQLHAQVPRLRELRQKKAEDPMAFLDNGVDGPDDAPDNISLAPTDTTNAGTFMTRYTNRSTGTLATNATRKTSKNRRREERKRARGKKGTVYEEEYLVNSIARLIERLNSTGEDASKLVAGLMRRTMRERAVAVQIAFQDVVESCQSCMEEVFSEASQGAQVAPVDAQARPWGGEGVLWDAERAAQQKREAPVLKAFEGLSLLDK